jgi:hypothetical protein
MPPHILRTTENNRGDQQQEGKQGTIIEEERILLEEQQQQRRENIAGLPPLGSAWPTKDCSGCASGKDSTVLPIVYTQHLSAEDAAIQSQPHMILNSQKQVTQLDDDNRDGDVTSHGEQTHDTVYVGDIDGKIDNILITGNPLPASPLERGITTNLTLSESRTDQKVFMNIQS